MLTHRQMLQSDINFVAEIEASANQFPWSVKNFQDCLKANNSAWVFIDDSNQLVGFTIVQKVVDELHLLNICVAPIAQRKGFGRHILNHVIDYANKLESVLIVLEVRRSNERAQQLYLDLGFNEMSVRKGYYPGIDGREDAILMGLDIGLMSLFTDK